MNLDNLSAENLNRIKEVLKIILDELELQGVNKLTFNKIPLKKFEEKKIDYQEVRTIINKIDSGISCLNSQLKADINFIKAPFKYPLQVPPPEFGKVSTKYELLEARGISEDDLNKYVLLKVDNLKKLKEIYNKIGKKDNLNKNKAEIKKPISEITCVRPKSGNKFIVVLNNDYQNTIKGDKAKLCWDLLFRVAEEERVPSDEKYKGYLDYFNTNKRNRLYTQTKYKVTKILKTEGSIIIQNIKINVISEKAFKTRVKRA